MHGWIQIKVLAGDKIYAAILDTGSERNFISGSMAEELGSATERISTFEMLCAIGMKTRI